MPGLCPVIDKDTDMQDGERTCLRTLSELVRVELGTASLGAFCQASWGYSFTLCRLSERGINGGGMERE